MSVHAKNKDYPKSTYVPVPFEETAAYMLKQAKNSDNHPFANACATAGVEMTLRQARAYMAKRGRWANR